MEVNPLLTHSDLGTVKKILFNNPPAEKVFGYTPPRDPEGAREVMMLWKGHKPSPSQDQVNPKQDFKTLNKMAIASGLSTAKEQPAFRKEHAGVMVKTQKDGGSPSRRNASPTIPSSKTGTVFGMPSAHRTAEVSRTHGPDEPPVKFLVQGAYQDDWVRKNLEAEAAGAGASRPYIPPQPTKAVLGHSYGSLKYLQPPNNEEPWKMSKFKAVGPKVTQFNGKGTRSPARASGAAPYAEAPLDSPAAAPYEEEAPPS
ncbi:hypothetical protein HYH03_013441 [Edaphochlamys debaryana]|uniref:Uncharacterized protein n=1 Tax=Edaphochlamys debaryana TaxID=47281 RepID=A0A836BUK0_9CHLO|nr:hypothetical protein HYH03_013441 [Edaphochlamys debaryana]|eukprot:KAG2488004.1 hypothetical protein HYH03_013441 [Edaphochlamys debaryana]